MARQTPRCCNSSVQPLSHNHVEASRWDQVRQGAVVGYCWLLCPGGDGCGFHDAEWCLSDDVLLCWLQSRFARPSSQADGAQRAAIRCACFSVGAVCWWDGGTDGV